MQKRTSRMILENCRGRRPDHPAAAPFRTVYDTARGIQLLPSFIYPAGIKAAAEAADQLPPPPAEININPVPPYIVSKINF